MLPDADRLIDRQQAFSGKSLVGRGTVQAHIQLFAPKQPFLLGRGGSKMFRQ